jgi:hypothetical protein
MAFSFPFFLPLSLPDDLLKEKKSELWLEFSRSDMFLFVGIAVILEII